jgi:hypothetical protein
MQYIKGTLFGIKYHKYDSSQILHGFFFMPFGLETKIFGVLQ